MKKILLIAYQFPPFAGVGTFRWAQLCKYLVRMGHEIHVVTVNWDDMGSNTLLEAVQHEHIHIHRISSGYPHNFRLKKYKYHFMRALQRRMFEYYFNKKYPHDMAEPWGKHLIPYATQLIEKEKISVVIATGAPFMVNVHAAKLKENLPHIKLIQDMRDLWFSDTRLNQPSNPLYAERKMLESYAMQGADKVVVVTEGLKQAFEKNAGSTPVELVRNGYDPEKFKFFPRVKKDNFHFVHLGTVASGREECCIAFLEYMRYAKAVSATFAGDLNVTILHEYDDLIAQGRLKFLGFLGQDQCSTLLETASFALHFNARHVPEAASTKFYEYAASGCPVVSFNYGGESDYLISKYKLGVSINLADEAKSTAEIHAIIQEFSYSEFAPLSVDNFSYVNIAKQYSKIINTI